MIYTLVGEQPDSDSFYHITESLARKMKERMKGRIYVWVRQFQHVMNKNSEELNVPEWYLPEVEEGSLELLLLGICYRWVHSEKKEQQWQKMITFEKLQKTIDYLEKGGEFQEEIIRWKPWMVFFSFLDGDKFEQLWLDVVEILKWMQIQGDCQLKEFIPGVEDFCERCQKSEKERIDYDLITRDIPFYYINMIGAQILNQCYQEAYSQCGESVIFLPGCMTYRHKFQQEGEELSCKARKDTIGFRCMHCSENCQVSKITKQLEKETVRVRILYHESEMNQKKQNPECKIGVIGISCVTGLLSGGWKARRLGYVPQCVLLEYCGCRQHWSPEKRIVTAINQRELFQRVRLCPNI